MNCFQRNAVFGQIFLWEYMLLLGKGMDSGGLNEEKNYTALFVNIYVSSL